MARTDQHQPGRRRATPAPKRRASKAEKPPKPPKPPKPGKPPKPQRTVREPSATAPRHRIFGAWLAVTAVGLGLCLVGWSPFDLPHWLPTVGAVILSTAYAVGLAVRTGGPPYAAGGLCLVITVVAVLTESPILLSGVTVGTASLAAVLGVMATKPAAKFWQVVREVVLASLVAAVGAFAVEAYQAPVSIDRAAYLALGVSLLGAVGLIYRLGAGLHGLGTRGTVGVVSGIILLFVGLAYSEALSRWGTGDLTDNVTDGISWIHDTLGAVPRPTVFLLGVPALAWGVSTRARRRQGWWVCAFGAAGLSVVATSLLNPALSLAEAGLALAYSLAVGLALGYLVVRADAYFTGTRGRRARKLEEQSAHRPEPARIDPLF